MDNGTKFLIGGLVVIGLGYLGMKYYYPPNLVVNAINPLDGTGTYQFGDTTNPIGPQGVSGGWGWTGTFTTFVPGTGWTFVVSKNGTVYNTVTVNQVGKISL